MTAIKNVIFGEKHIHVAVLWDAMIIITKPNKITGIKQKQNLLLRTHLERCEQVHWHSISNATEQKQARMRNKIC